MTVGDYVAVVTALFAGGGLAYAARTLRQAQIANGFPLVADVLKEFREMSSDRHLVLNSIGSYDPNDGYRGLPDSIRLPVIRVSHYVDSVGLLVSLGLANEEAVAGFIGDAVIPLWVALSPFIAREREIREGDYQAYFEDLAVRITKIGPARARRKLKRFS